MTAKYLEAVIDRAKGKAQRDVLCKLWDAVAPSYRVTLSHNNDNTTERTIRTRKGFCDSVARRADEALQIWVFLYGPNDDNARPSHWVRLTPSNDAADLICDYTMGCNHLIEPVTKYAEKYD